MLRKITEKMSRWWNRVAQPHVAINERVSSFNIPVLCYHSWTVSGVTYEKNDHVALEHDLKFLGERGYQILPVADLVALLRGEISTKAIEGKKLVCITCDDGRDYDYITYQDRQWGEVTSFYEILKRSQAWLSQFSSGHRAVSFVIASPEARSILDRTCGNGLGEWQDSWWEESTDSGILGVANHSWDHVHDTLDEVRQKENKKGSFFEISTFEDAEAQIADAQVFIRNKTNNKSLPYFGYPYGHVPDYLRDDYFPNNGERLDIRAAFSTEGVSVREGCCVWDIPRFVCGGHWKGREEFSILLDAVEKGER